MIEIEGIDEIYLSMAVIFNLAELGSKEQKRWVEEKEVARLEEISLWRSTQDYPTGIIHAGLQRYKPYNPSTSTSACHQSSNVQRP
jgi:hypothetical protein